MTPKNLIVAGPPALVDALVALLVHLPETSVRVSRREPAGRAERLLVTTSDDRADALALAFSPELLIETDAELPAPQPFPAPTQPFDH